jgi:hypothetical protein
LNRPRRTSDQLPNGRIYSMRSKWQSMKADVKSLLYSKQESLKLSKNISTLSFLKYCFRLFITGNG